MRERLVTALVWSTSAGLMTDKVWLDGDRPKLRRRKNKVLMDGDVMETMTYIFENILKMEQDMKYLNEIKLLTDEII